MSKYSKEEYDAYDKYFYSKRDGSVKKAFDYAWRHHQCYNEHHWQHWLLRNDDGSYKVLDMPYNYIVEMVCDHWAFSWAEGNLFEIFDWYKNNKPKMLLSPTTQEQYENILDKLKSKLEQKIKDNS